MQPCRLVMLDGKLFLSAMSGTSGVSIDSSDTPCLTPRSYVEEIVQVSECRPYGD